MRTLNVRTAKQFMSVFTRIWSQGKKESSQLIHLAKKSDWVGVKKIALINLSSASGNYLFDIRNDPKLIHKTYWKVHLNSEEVFLLDIAAVLSPAIKDKQMNSIKHRGQSVMVVTFGSKREIFVESSNVDVIQTWSNHRMFQIED